MLAALLSFLGLGPLPPFAELGSMAADGRKYLEVFPHISTIPTLVIFGVVLVVNLLGDSLRDAFDLRIQS
ncbi:Glutathione transport system permease protein GsiD [compost metagenome]